MTRPALIPTPMPVVLSTVSDLETALGKGHPLLVPARLALEGFKPRACRSCGIAIDWTFGLACEACAARNRTFMALEDAFYALAECLRLVDAHTTALMTVDGSSSFAREEWRALSFHALGLIFESTPELLPFQFGGDS